MVDLLAEFQRRMKSVPPSAEGGSTDLLLGLMDPVSAKQLRLCAIPHQFNVKILQALDTTLDAAQAKERCAEFATLSLVMPDRDSWALHDTARGNLFRQWLTPENACTFEVASAKLVSYFDARAAQLQGEPLATARRKRMYHLIGAEQAEGFAEFERLCRQARHQLRFSECANLIRLAHDYDSVLAPERALWLLYHEGKLAADLRQWDESEKKFHQIRENSTSPSGLLILAYVRLGYVYQQNRSWGEAIKYYESALDLARDTAASRHVMPRLLCELGGAYRDSGKLAQAEKLLQQSVLLARGQENWSDLASAYNNLGTLSLKRRDIEPAIELFDKSIDCLKRIKDVFRTAQVYNNLGLAYADLPDFGRSEDYFDKSLEIKRQAGDTLGQASALNNVARAQAGQNKLPEAIQSSSLAISLFKEMREIYNTALAQHNLGKLYRRIKDIDAARKNFAEAAEGFRVCNKTDELAVVEHNLQSLDKKQAGLPWWTWVALVVFGLFALLLVVASVAALVEGMEQS